MINPTFFLDHLRDVSMVTNFGLESAKIGISCLHSLRWHSTTDGKISPRMQALTPPMTHLRRTKIWWTSVQYSLIFATRYETIRYIQVKLRALKSWRNSQLDLAHGTETKIRKTENKNRLAQKIRCGQKSVKAVRAYWQARLHRAGYTPGFATHF